MVWVKSIVVCHVSVVFSKYESNLIINKEVVAILAKLWGCAHLLHYLSKMKKIIKKIFFFFGGGGILGWDGWTVFQK